MTGIHICKESNCHTGYELRQYRKDIKVINELTDRMFDRNAMELMQGIKDITRRTKDGQRLIIPMEDVFKAIETIKAMFS